MARGDDAGDPALDDADVAAALRVLERVAGNRTVLARLDAETRVTLQRLAGEVARPDLKARKKLQKALLRGEHRARRARDAALRGDTGIQQLRQAPVFVAPLPALPPPGTDARAWQPTLPDAAAPPAAAAPSGQPVVEDEGPELTEPRKCYVCKTAYRRLHRFYDQLCRACGDENHARRTATVDLRGRVALVTGARVKIGYQAAILLLLRAGCSVVVCTRFPRDAAARYAREADFPAWTDRLAIHGVDLRHTPSVELLCQRLDATPAAARLPAPQRLPDRAPPAGLLRAPASSASRRPGPRSPAPSGTSSRDHEALTDALRGRGAAAACSARRSSRRRRARPISSARAGPGSSSSRGRARPGPPAGRSAHAQLLAAPARRGPDPRAARGAAGQRHRALRDDRAAEAAHAARAAPPPGTATSGDAARHVVLVSAMEGQFYREHKTDRHPHTNMAKAALNMLVRTSAPDYARDGIHLNAVDTGWVTDEDPAHLAERKAEEHAFSPPLDIVDGAARIVAPIFDGFRTGRHEAGLFFKDYRPTPW